MSAISICKFDAYGKQTIGNDRLFPIHLIHDLVLLLYCIFRMNFLHTTDSTRIAFNLSMIMFDLPEMSIKGENCDGYCFVVYPTTQTIFETYVN